MAYFVTGATGFIGRHLVQELLDHRDGDDLRAGARGLAGPHREADPVVGHRPGRPRRSAT